jgi:hypothetical protein
MDITILHNLAEFRSRAQMKQAGEDIGEILFTITSAHVTEPNDLSCRVIPLRRAACQLYDASFDVVPTEEVKHINMITDMLI